MAKKQPSQQFIITEKEPAEPDTIWFIFDYYKNRGYDSLPPNVTVETEPFKKNLYDSIKNL